ncbi:hypothetical protein CGMCC3_g15405 [Colletotrichum fructicola]|nr:uncharacterized protein CGMCC3_g15405 [Colletotrichum fructicola]KAE9568473.1 hypothetical protein CGMCC3_g15405 [Colletotrichum fructicola]
MEFVNKAPYNRAPVKRYETTRFAVRVLGPWGEGGMHECTIEGSPISRGDDSTAAHSRRE